MIEFEPNIEQPRLLRKATRWAKRNTNPFPSVSDLAPKLSTEELKRVAQSWQKAGLGNLIEVSENGQNSIHFSLDQAALLLTQNWKERSFLGRIKSVSRSDWIAFAAFVVSVIALFKPGS